MPTKICDNVYVRRSQLLHTIVMVLGRVDSIHTQDIGEYLLEVRDITFTAVAVCQGVGIRGALLGAVRIIVLLVCHTSE